MSASPKPGDSVTFRVGEGHRVPMCGRPGRFYPEGVDITETWTPDHFPRLRTGALVLVPQESAPPAPEPEVTQ